MTTTPDSTRSTDLPVQWFDDYQEEEAGFDIDEYDLTSSPNDFNVDTIYNFIESGSVTIPGFQRNFIWDQPRASKLIESLILGLPVPQVFLFEKSRNNFQVVDGQQRLMSIYYFIKGRFPLKEKRGELRRLLQSEPRIPPETLSNDEYFSDFALRLPNRVESNPSKFEGLTYESLGEFANSFRLRPVRVVVIRQNRKTDDDSAVYEIFSRLNTGGVNLTPQEIRSCLFQSPFYDGLTSLNSLPGWRRLLRQPDPDLHLKDIEVLLRAFALLIDGPSYKPSMVRFLNTFSRRSQSNSLDQNTYISELFHAFLRRASSFPADIFVNPETNRFGIGLFESTFAAMCGQAFANKSLEVPKVTPARVSRLLRDKEFVNASYGATTSISNVKKRLALGRRILLGSS